MRKVDLHRWEKYFNARDKGMSVEQASRYAAIDPKTAYRFESGDPSSSGIEVAAMLGRNSVGGRLVAQPISEQAQHALADFAYFRLRYFGRTSTPWQERAAYEVVRLAATADREYLVVNSPPGGGKSTLFTHDIPCWLVARDRALRLQFGSRTERQARMYVGRMKKTLERDAPLRADADSIRFEVAEDAKATMADDFGPFKPDGRSDLWRGEALVVRQPNGMAPDDKEPTVSAWGKDSGFLGGRFDFVIWDDLVDRKMLRTPEAYDDLVEWYLTEAETRLEPRGLLILQGQRMAADDLYRFVLDLRTYEGDPKYHHIRYPAHDDARCKGVHDGPNVAAWPNGCLLDPYRLPWRVLSAVRAADPKVYDIQYQQNDGEATSQLVELPWIHGGLDSAGIDRRGCLDTDRAAGTCSMPQETGWSLLSVDPSPTEYWGITWWVLDPEANTFEMVDLWRQRMGSEAFLSLDLDTGEYSGLAEEIRARSVEIGHPLQTMVIEINAAQRYLVSQPHVQRWIALNGITLIPHTTSTNKADPEYGVTSIADFFRQGVVRLPHGDVQGRIRVKELIHELVTWPEGRTDDLVMSVWFALRTSQFQYVPRKQRTRFERPAWVARAGRVRGMRWGAGEVASA